MRWSWINLKAMFNKLSDAIQWIETQIKFKPKTDLTRMKDAYEMLGLDLSQIKKIHVGGTNGKGSVCAYLSHVLIEAGYKVGTYTSPYLLRFNERIRIQFHEIEDQDLFDLILRIYKFNQAFEAKHGEFLSFFELLTLMALIYFSEQKVDVIIMEVGLGGLLDATNVLNYDLSLITSIGFDHMKQLGNTLESIAYNKLGIVKPYNHLITTVDESLHEQFYKHCLDVLATYEFYTKKHLKIISDYPLRIMHDHVIYELSMLGDYQQLNALLAIKAIHYLFPKISTSIIQKGLKKTVWAGRLENIRPKTYIDGAHNTHAIESLLSLAHTTFKNKNIYVLFSALGDKDIPTMLNQLSTLSKHIYITSFPDSRYVDLRIYEKDNLPFIKDPLDALIFIESQMAEDDILLITGSLHFAGYMKKVASTL